VTWRERGAVAVKAISVTMVVLAVIAGVKCFIEAL